MTRPSKRKKIRTNTKTSRRVKSVATKGTVGISFKGAHPLISKHWDKNLTLKQNYQRMGLISDINGVSGGSATTTTTTTTTVNDSMEDDHGDDNHDDIQPVIEFRSFEEFNAMPTVSSVNSKKQQQQQKTSEDLPKHMVLEDALDEQDIQIDPRSTMLGSLPSTTATTKTKTRATRTSKLASTTSGPSSSNILSKHPITPLPVNVAEEMAKQAQKAAEECTRIITRTASEGEKDVLITLVKKYKDDVEAMAGDIKLNVFQLSAGQLKRKLRKANLI